MSTVSFFSILADLSVASKQHKMPPKDSWKPPQNKGKESKDNYTKGVGESNWGPQYPVADGVISYFATQDAQTYHFNSATSATADYKAFIHTMLDAVKYAFNIWKMTLYFKDLKVNGPTAVGSTGCLTSSMLPTGKNADLGCACGFFTTFLTFPKHAQYAQNEHYADWRDAVGRGVAQCLKKYVDNVTVPGLPWYPAFTAFPGPMAPPMPNVTTPLMACPSSGMTELTVAKKIQDAIIKEFKNGLKDKSNDSLYKTIFGAIADSLSVGFMTWLSTQVVNLVMGTGQIPTFAPPVVPVGPVVNGQNIPTMGGNLV